MHKSLLSSPVLCCVAALALASPATAQTRYILDNVRPFVIPSGKPVAVADIHAALQQELESKIFKEEMPLKGFLKTLRDNLKDRGKDIGETATPPFRGRSPASAEH